MTPERARERDRDVLGCLGCLSALGGSVLVVALIILGLESLVRAIL